MTTMFTTPKELHTASLAWSTPSGDDVIAYLARVSAPHNQERMEFLTNVIEGDSSLLMLFSQQVEYDSYVNGEDLIELAQDELNTMTSNLINFCITNGHWSILEMASMCVTVKTTRAISAQMIRHRSFSFQEFSQRYAAVNVNDVLMPEMRMVNESGRKRDSSQGVYDDGLGITSICVESAYKTYDFLINEGVHPESARNVLPMCASTLLAMNGTVRSWYHYLTSRLSSHTQKEHRQVAQSIKAIFDECYPTVSKTLEVDDESNKGNTRQDEDTFTII